MRWWRVKRRSDGEVTLRAVDSDANTPPADFPADEFDVQPHGGDPTDLDSHRAGLVDDAAKANAWAERHVIEEADRRSLDTVQSLRRQIAIDRTWNEIQRFKLATATGNAPTTAGEKRRQFPTLAALVTQAGGDLATVATALEARLWERVRRNAAYEAKLMLAHDAVRAAVTPEEKLAAALGVDWSA